MRPERAAGASTRGWKPGSLAVIQGEPLAALEWGGGGETCFMLASGRKGLERPRNGAARREGGSDASGVIGMKTCSTTLETLAVQGAPPVGDEEGPLASASVTREAVELQYVSVCPPGSARQVWEERAALDRCSLLQALVFPCYRLTISALAGMWPSLVKVEVRSAPGLPQAPDSGVGGQYFHPSCHLGTSLAIWRYRWGLAPGTKLCPRGTPTQRPS